MEVTLRQLTYYVRLYEKRSYTAAAQSLGITQPALSISISQMESALQVPLVERGTQPIGFTEFGEVLFRYAERILHDLDHARADIAAIESGKLGKLDIAIGPSATGLRVGRVLTQICDDYPQLEIRVQTGVMPNMAEALLSGKFSLYLGTVAGQDIPEALSCEPLSEISLVPVCGAGHPLAGRGMVSAEELVSYPWIAVGNIDENVPGWRDQFAAQGVDPPRLALEVRSLALLQDMLVEGRFITLLPEPMVTAEVEAGILAIVRSQKLRWTLQLELVTRADTSLPSAARIFVERLKEAFYDEDH